MKTSVGYMGILYYPHNFFSVKLSYSKVKSKF